MWCVVVFYSTEQIRCYRECSMWECLTSFTFTFRYNDKKTLARAMTSFCMKLEDPSWTEVGFGVSSLFSVLKISSDGQLFYWMWKFYRPCSRQCASSSLQHLGKKRFVRMLKEADRHCLHKVVFLQPDSKETRLHKAVWSKKKITFTWIRLKQLKTM